MKKYLTSDVGRILDLTPDAVRKMAARGTLRTAERTIGGVRLFDHADVFRLARARAARRAERASQEA